MKFGTGLNTELTQKYTRVKVQNDIVCPHIKYKQTNMTYIILIARVRVQYGKIFYEHAKYFHEPKASENVA